VKVFGRRQVLGVLSVLAATLVSSPAPAATKVALCLQWVHQAQFAGFYVAQDAGIYRRYGLQVEIRPGGPQIDPLTELGAGRCRFATAWLSEALDRRARGMPLVHLAQLIQRSALMLVTFADGQVKTLQDLRGRRVGLWPRQFAVPPRALFARLGVKVREVRQGVSMAPFLARAVVAATAMAYNEYHQLFQAGIDSSELRVFEFAKLGLNFPEDGLYTLDSTWRKNPELCRRFVAASLAGWRRALARPAEALTAVMRRIDPHRSSSNLSHQRYMLRTIERLMTFRVGMAGLGRLSRRDFDQVNRVLVDQGLISAPVPAEGFVAPVWKRP